MASGVGMSMFAFPETRNRRRGASLLFSLLIHCVVVFLWLYRAPIFVKPSSAAAGAHGVSTVVTYFPSPSEAKPAVKKPSLRYQAKPTLAQEQSAKSAPAVGTEYGSVGSTSGTEARPALPVVFPDPAIFPWQLPNGLTGDVIVEVTIDDQGAVTETKLLQSLKPDIDQKVVATVRSWRFRPATVDGVAISSRQDVHFHYPG